MTTGTEAGHTDGWRGRLGRLVEGRRFQRFIMALMILNAVTLGLETSQGAMAAAGPAAAGRRPNRPGVFRGGDRRQAAVSAPVVLP